MAALENSVQQLLNSAGRVFYGSFEHRQQTNQFDTHTRNPEKSKDSTSALLGPDVAGLSESLKTVMEQEMKPTMRTAMVDLQKELDAHYSSGYTRQGVNGGFAACVKSRANWLPWVLCNDVYCKPYVPAAEGVTRLWRKTRARMESWPARPVFSRRRKLSIRPAARSALANTVACGPREPR